MSWDGDKTYTVAKKIEKYFSISAHTYSFMCVYLLDTGS